MTVVIRTLVITNPVKYSQKLVELIKLTKNRKYWQEFIKLFVLHAM